MLVGVIEGVGVTDGVLVGVTVLVGVIDGVLVGVIVLVGVGVGVAGIETGISMRSKSPNCPTLLGSFTSKHLLKDSTKYCTS